MWIILSDLRFPVQELKSREWKIKFNQYRSNNDFQGNEHDVKENKFPTWKCCRKKILIYFGYRTRQKVFFWKFLNDKIKLWNAKIHNKSEKHYSMKCTVKKIILSENQRIFPVILPRLQIQLSCITHLSAIFYSNQTTGWSFNYSAKLILLSNRNAASARS